MRGKAFSPENSVNQIAWCDWGVQFFEGGGRGHFRQQTPPYRLWTAVYDQVTAVAAGVLGVIIF